MPTLTERASTIDAPDPTDARVLFDTVYRLHRRALYGFLLRLTLGDAHAAEDLLQETLIRAWRQVRDRGGDPAVLRPWLYTVARRVAIDAARARASRVSECAPPDLTAFPAEDDPYERSLTGLAVRRGLATLSPRHRSVLIEIFYRGRTARETADVLGLPIGTVKSREFHALRMLARSGAVQPESSTRDSRRPRPRRPG